MHLLLRWVKEKEDILAAEATALDSRKRRMCVCVCVRMHTHAWVLGCVHAHSCC